ncbi:hypothetical protein GCM10010329_48720 [Streptomyces spiroverticillatus]|uniref:Uncharacterized protein n=1 Tax=Streptomyces finlayi TaxID=67296 RepID=A0A918X1T3_9ACTN|nr:hypothetical protein [Streptomyces finlayi]GHA19896.1 hypothetical protein GCM10010329_48720 [Streptomyces spiroverticillatus]GHD02741.1 hypothetical protein GCM10010334_49670 [Streptomyces finlayi]
MKFGSHAGRKTAAFAALLVSAALLAPGIPSAFAETGDEKGTGVEKGTGIEKGPAAPAPGPTPPPPPLTGYAAIAPGAFPTGAPEHAPAGLPRECVPTRGKTPPWVAKLPAAKAREITGKQWYKDWRATT